MPVIAFVNQKGGCSKSTSSVHLAYWLQKHKSEVLVVDADVQKSSSRWLSSLDGGDQIPYEVLSTPNELLDALPKLARRYQYLVVDGPAGLTEATRAILLRSDLAVVPCQPTGLDLDSARETIYLIEQAQSVRSGKPAAVVFLSRATKGTRLKMEASQLLQKSGLQVMESVIHQRQVLADVFGQGQILWTTKGRPAKESAREYDKLFKEIMEQLDDPAKIT